MSLSERPLDLARADLARRASLADKAGDAKECALLEHLASIADMVCRIGDHPDSAHYRADKSGPLLRSAAHLQLECLRSYLGGADDDAQAELDEATDVLEKVQAAVRRAMWVIAGAHRGANLEDDDLRALTSAAKAFTTWASAVVDRAGTTRLGTAVSPPAARTPTLAADTGRQRAGRTEPRGRYRALVPIVLAGSRAAFEIRFSMPASMAARDYRVAPPGNLRSPLGGRREARGGPLRIS